LASKKLVIPIFLPINPDIFVYLFIDLIIFIFLLGSLAILSPLAVKL